MADAPLRILGISGSLRAGANSTAVLETLVDLAPRGLTIHVHSLADIPLYNADIDVAPRPAKAQEFMDAVTAADGLLIVTPEYNYGAPGLLKNAIDWASRPAMKSPLLNKHALIASQSPGGSGGVRANSQVREALLGCGAKVIHYRQIAIGQANAKISNGRLTDQASIDFAVAGLVELRREILRARVEVD